MKGDSDGCRKRFESAMQADITENILLRNSILDDDCRRELREINKHELIIKICEILGSSPSDLCKAEEIFEVFHPQTPEIQTKQAQSRLLK